MRVSLGVALSDGATTLCNRPDPLGVISLMNTVGGLPLAISMMMPPSAEDIVRTDVFALLYRRCFTDPTHPMGANLLRTICQPPVRCPQLNTAS